VAAGGKADNDKRSRRGPPEAPRTADLGATAAGCLWALCQRGSRDSRRPGRRSTVTWRRGTGIRADGRREERARSPLWIADSEQAPRPSPARCWGRSPHAQERRTVANGPAGILENRVAAHRTQHCVFSLAASPVRAPTRFHAGSMARLPACFALACACRSRVGRPHRERRHCPAGKCRHALRAQISVVAARSGEGWGWPQRWRRRGRLSVPHGCLARSPTVACPTETHSDTGQFEAERTRVGGWGRSEGRSAAGGTDASDSLSRSGGWWKAGRQSQARRRLPALVFRAARSSPVFASERAE
jgi:hypothetical protein